MVVAIPYGRYQALPVEALAGKIFISAANYCPERDGEIEPRGRAQPELIAQHLPDTRVVKAFNTIWHKHLAEQGDTAKPIAERRAIFVAGDDERAKAVVDNLIEEIGFGPVDTGSPRRSTVQELGTAIYSVDITVNEERSVLG